MFSDDEAVYQLGYWVIWKLLSLDLKNVRVIGIVGQIASATQSVAVSLWPCPSCVKFTATSVKNQRGEDC